MERLGIVESSLFVVVDRGWLDASLVSYCVVMYKLSIKPSFVFSSLLFSSLLFFSSSLFSSWSLCESLSLVGKWV